MTPSMAPSWNTRPSPDKNPSSIQDLVWQDRRASSPNEALANQDGVAGNTWLSSKTRAGSPKPDTPTLPFTSYCQLLDWGACMFNTSSRARSLERPLFTHATLAEYPS